MAFFGAIDLGASSGRVAVGEVTESAITFRVIHRFQNRVIEKDGSFLWDWIELVKQVDIGLSKAADNYDLESVGVDTWAVDYVLINESGEIMAPTYSYRDTRTDKVFDEITEKFGREIIYRNSGIQFLTFNTLYQLVAANKKGELQQNRKFLMLPDAMNLHLTNSRSNEVTNASSTQLLNARTRKWDWELIDLLGLPREIFPELHEAKTVLGNINQPRLNKVKVVAVGSHDTASAVAAAPMSNPDSQIYISSGTWSLIGCEIEEPITNANALKADLTNELGVEGKVRLLKNVTGMWIVSECLREWRESGETLTVQELVELAKDYDGPVSIFNPNDSIFMHPGPMVNRIQEICKNNGLPIPTTKGAIGKSIYFSLASSYREWIEKFSKVTNKKFTEIYVVGGGSANDYLNQLTANETSLPVTAGPVEATLLGNIGVQALAAGVIKDLATLRRLIAEASELTIYYPKK